MIEPQPNALATIAQRTIGFLSMETGISGSGAVSRRSTKSEPMISATANSARIGGEVHG